MRLTIIFPDGLVYKDGVQKTMDLSSVPKPPSATILQWYDTEGEIEHQGAKNSLNETIDTLPDWAVAVATVFDSIDNSADNADSPEEIERKMRVWRDMLLLESDWTQLADAQASLSPSEKAQWEVYRQQLRDVPASADFPSSVSWPTNPKGVKKEPVL